MTLEEAVAIVDKAQEARDEALVDLVITYEASPGEVWEDLEKVVSAQKLFEAALDVWYPLDAAAAAAAAAAKNIAAHAPAEN